MKKLSTILKTLSSVSTVTRERARSRFILLFIYFYLCSVDGLCNLKILIFSFRKRKSFVGKFKLIGDLCGKRTRVSSRKSSKSAIWLFFFVCLLVVVEILVS